MNTKINDHLLEILDRCNESGTHCVAIRFGPEPLLMFGGNRIPAEHCAGYIELRDSDFSDQRQHFTLDDIVRAGVDDSVIKIAAFNFAETPPKGILADLPEEPDTPELATIQRMYVIHRLYLHGEFFAGGTQYHFQIAYIALGPTGGEGGMLVSDNIFGQRQMHAVTRLLLDEGDDQRAW